MNAFYIDNNYIYRTIGRIDYEKLISVGGDDITYQAYVYYNRYHYRELKQFLAATLSFGFKTKALKPLNLADDLLSTKADKVYVAAYDIETFKRHIKAECIVVDKAFAIAQSLVMPSDVLRDVTKDGSTNPD